MRLSDEAIRVLKNGNLNNRLISELLTHKEFQQLLNAIEVYIDQKVIPQIKNMNAMYKLAEETIKDNCSGSENDTIITFLKESVINEDDYLRYRISERFNSILKSLFEAHKKDALPEEQNNIINQMKNDIDLYIKHKEFPERAKMLLLARQLQLNLNKLSNEEIDILLKSLSRSEKFKKVAARK